jgi:hypothetical protein
MYAKSLPQAIEQPRKVSVNNHKVTGRLFILYRALASALVATTARSEVKPADRWQPLDGR